MVGLITDKLNQYPNLVQEINKRGGLAFLQNSTHNMGNGRWSSKNPKNMFIRSLIQAYQNVTSTNITTEEETSEVVTVNYGGNQFIYDDGKYYYTKEGGKGAEVKDKNLEIKIRLTKAVLDNPQNVVNLKIGNSEQSYYSIDNRVFSLQPTSFGKEIISNNIKNRVLNINNTKIEDKPQEIKNENTLEKEKPSFTYNNVTVNTEFKLSKEQSDALITLINFVEKGSEINNDMYDNTYTLEGYAGTGKTSIIGVLEKYIKAKNNYTEFIYLAPTHAATVALGLNIVKYGAKELPITVQSSIFERRDNFGNLVVSFTKKFNDRATKLNNIIVLDESSMLANVDFDKLIKAAKEENHKIIFMGDPKQIPEVTPNVNIKEIGKAFNNSNKVVLTEVFRTKDNNILSLLTNIRKNTEYQNPNFEKYK
jgi:hypothetical protein